MITLRPRLTKLLNEIDAECCADIGCDHGKLIVSALKNNKILRGYAVDISQKSLQKAEQLSREEGVSSRLTLLCGDGAAQLPEKVNVAVIAGMGANETVHILRQGDFADKYVLSPHQDPQILRKYLADNNYFIEKDYIIFDKKFYPIIIARKGESNYSESEYFMGKNSPKTKEFDQYLQIRTQSIQKLIENIGDKINCGTKKEWEECQKWNNKK